jgi:hypothetical protein
MNPAGNLSYDVFVNDPPPQDGDKSADVIAALWPDRCRALVSVSGYLIGSQAANAAPLPPRAIAVPAITLEGDANGAPHADASAYAGKFTGQYEHRVIEGGIGHNLPQEAPRAFARAVIDVDAL